MEETERFYGMSPLPEEEKHRILDEEYFPKIHFYGLWTSLVHIFILFLPVIYLAVFHGLFPPWDVAIKAFIGIASFAAPFWFVEPISFFFILGAAGTYVAFLGGNISNMRVPVCTVAQEVAGVREGSPEGEIIAGLGILASQWILTIATLTGAVVITTLIDVLPAGVRSALESFILPSIWGALIGQFSMRNIRYGIVAFISGILVCWLITPTYGWLEVPVLVFGMAIFAIVTYRQGIWVPE